PPVISLAPDVPTDLDALIGSMLAKDRNARPRDGADVAKQLRGIRADSRSVACESSRATLSSREQRSLTFMLVADPSDLLEEEDGGRSERCGDPERELKVATAIQTAGAARETILGSFLVTVPPSGVPSDRATRLSRCALALNAILPERAIVL